MKNTVTAAASMVGLSPKTLYAHIASGKLSASVDRDGQKTIDTSELIRAYGEIKERPAEKPQAANQPTTDELMREVERYKHNATILMNSNKHMREQITLLKEMLADARKRESELNKKYDQTVGLFERILPSIKD